ncbi:MAG: N-acetylmuramoyl-L-alanine amidase [Bacteroidetes bacterium]|nr:N-acetylmuramoyl-L-alanine amidase [Bacteroidota bacterium]
MKYRFYIFILLCLGCARNPYASTNKIYKQQSNEFAKVIKTYPVKDSLNTVAFVGTTNFNLRKPNFVIIHHTAQNSCEQTLKTFTLSRTQVSAHYVICKDGTIHHMLNDYLRAWHAGVSKWGNDADVNSSSIGIELDNNGYESFTADQIKSLLRLLAALKKQYNIPQANFIGHADVAPTRKNDPNVNFPWKKLAENGYGYWYDDTTNIVLPSSFNDILALRIIGYSVKDTTAAITAFKRHWLQDTLAGGLDTSQEKVLYQVMKKYE